MQYNLLYQYRAILEIEYMGASESGPTTECKVCGKVFRTIEDLVTHNREAHSGSISTGTSQGS